MVERTPGGPGAAASQVPCPHSESQGALHWGGGVQSGALQTSQDSQNLEDEGKELFCFWIGITRSRNRAFCCNSLLGDLFHSESWLVLFKGLLVFTAFSMALLTVSRTFLPVLGKAGRTLNILPIPGVETYSFLSKALTSDPSFSPSLGATQLPGSQLPSSTKIRLAILDYSKTFPEHIFFGKPFLVS